MKNGLWKMEFCRPNRRIEREVLIMNALVPTDIKFGNPEISIFHERKHYFHSIYGKMFCLNSEYSFGAPV